MQTQASEIMPSTKASLKDLKVMDFKVNVFEIYWILGFMGSNVDLFRGYDCMDWLVSWIEQWFYCYGYFAAIFVDLIKSGSMELNW